MNAAYVSLDEVHQHHARLLAQDTGLRLEVFWPNESVPRSQYPIVIYDLDHLPAEQRGWVLDRLLSRPAKGVVAVHGYSLTPAQADLLCHNDVLVCQRLDAALLEQVTERVADNHHAVRQLVRDFKVEHYRDAAWDEPKMPLAASQR